MSLSDEQESAERWFSRTVTSGQWLNPFIPNHAAQHNLGMYLRSTKESKRDSDRQWGENLRGLASRVLSVAFLACRDALTNGLQIGIRTKATILQRAPLSVLNKERKKLWLTCLIRS